MPLSRASLAASATALLLACAIAPAAAETIAGRATVIDGETLEIRGARIRLFGIETPADDHVCARTDDNRWRCGPRTLTALDELLEEAIVSCTSRERDPLGRLIASCSVGPIDLSLWLLRNGFARAPAAAAGRYRQAESEAKAARRGIWAEGGEQ
jgi:endonuclease YncB( thermonuclease family)